MAELSGLNQKDLQRERVKTAATLLEQWAKESAQPRIDARKRLADVKVGTLVDPAKGDKLMKDLRGLIEEYVAEAGTEAGAALASAESAFGRLNLVVLILGLLGAGVAAGILVQLLRTVVAPITGILAWFDAMRAGKPFTLEITANNEIADVAEAFLRVGEELKHARKETELLSTTAENSTLPVMELKADGSVVYANPAAKKLAESVSITTAELLPTETLKQLGEFAGKDHTLRREKAIGEAKYDFVVRSAADKDTLFVVGFPKPAKKA
jgi:PAS domain-containing protein